jgi:hypothetical protein
MIIFYNKRQITKELTDLLNHDRSPLGNQRPVAILEPSMQRHLTHFSLITHGFGSPAIVAVLNSFQNYLSEMLKYYEKSFSSSTLSTSSSSTSSSSSNIGMNGQSLNGLNNGNLMNDHNNLNGMCMNNLISNGLINTNSMASLYQQQQQHYHHTIHNNDQNILSPKVSDSNSKKVDIIEKAR